MLSSARNPVILVGDGVDEAVATDGLPDCFELLLRISTLIMLLLPAAMGMEAGKVQTVEEAAARKLITSETGYFIEILV